jgi:hypothetical protein
MTYELDNIKCILLFHLQAVFISGIANCLRQRSLRQKRLKSSPSLPFISSKTKLGCVSENLSFIQNEEPILSPEQLECEIAMELKKTRPDISHLTVLNRHFYQSSHIPYKLIPPRLMLHSSLVS